MTVLSQDLSLGGASSTARVQAARALLEDSDLPVELVALRCGFRSRADMRRQFGRVLRTTPASHAARRSARVLDADVPAA